MATNFKIALAVAVLAAAPAALGDEPTIAASEPVLDVGRAPADAAALAGVVVAQEAQAAVPTPVEADPNTREWQRSEGDAK
jgi:hypothetical protein